MSQVHRAIRIVCLCYLTAAVLTSIGVAYARYSSSLRESLIFEAAQKDGSRAIKICSDSGWDAASDRAKLVFSLVNVGGVTGQTATLRLTATEGMDADGSTVVLTVDGTAYTGVAHTVVQGAPLYDKIGSATEYRFYTADRECVWAVSDGRTYTLTVTGEADASLLRLTATEI